jgi:hypothetical protein
VHEWEHNTDRWKLRISEMIQREEPIVHVFFRTDHARWLKDTLNKHGVHFRSYKIGNSVIVTTRVDQCPCCFSDKKERTDASPMCPLRV